MIPKRLAILQRLGERAEQITIANGFDTDAGQHVYLGAAPELGPADATQAPGTFPTQAIALVPRDDVWTEPNYPLVVLPIEIQALGYASIADAWVAVELLIGDIKRAIEQPDRTLRSILNQPLRRGSTRTLERIPGSLTIGTAVVYIATYIEPWGEPRVADEET